MTPLGCQGCWRKAENQGEIVALVRASDVQNVEDVV
jgi:hypothetical protein